MAYEDLLENWERFSLTTEEEATQVDVDRQAAVVTRQSLGFSLIGKLLARRIISGDVMRRTFKSAWNIPNGLIVEKLGANLFLFSLRSEADQIRVLRQEPWLFDKFLLVLSRPIPMVKPTAMEFKFASFYVHFYELPMDLYTQSMVERLGNAIGQFQSYDNGGQGYGWKESLRVRVILDITRPLWRGIKVRLDEPLGSVWTSIKYEKFPDICAFCGRNDHGMRDCTFNFLESGSSSRRQEYGMWMAFNDRTSRVFRSPTNSPIGNQQLMAASPNWNPSLPTSLKIETGARLDNSRKSSLMTGSGSRPMDISSVMEENGPVLAICNTPTINAGIYGINDSDFTKAKKKLFFGVE